MKILITGFDPFGGEKINPSYKAVKLLPEMINNIQIIKLELPTVFKKSLVHLENKIIEISPDVVICIGQAGGRSEICIERVAINIDVASIPDNEGNSPKNTKIIKEGENAYFSNLPINAMVAKCQDSNIPTKISNSAGTYVCNHVMYGLLHMIETKYSNIKGGFIHVPFIAEQVIKRDGTPFMSLEMISKGLVKCIEAITENSYDIDESYGETH